MPDLRIARTDEQVALGEVVRDLVSDLATPERVAEVADGHEPHDPVLWEALTQQLGIAGLLVPESHGGVGASWREASAVLGELGRTLAPVPFLPSSVLAVTALLSAADDERASEVLAAVAAGTSLAAVAMPVGIDPARGPASVTATAADGGTRLDGSVAHVVAGAQADHLVVLAFMDGDPIWVLVDQDLDGVDVVAVDVLDTTRPVARVTFDGAVGRELCRGEDAAATAGHVVDAAAVGFACEQAAASRYLLDLTVAYARDRVQFGRPIGSFQAIQHRCADLAVIVDECTSAVELAVWARCDAPEEARAAASLAAVVCGEGARTVATEAIQVHGGIGFTWEHVCHRYFRRAQTSAVVFGRPSEHRERLLQALGI